MKRFIFLVATITILTLNAYGCNSSNSTTPVKTVNVEMSEFKFVPSNLTVSAGHEVTLNLKNIGAVEHEFTILKKDLAAKIPFDRLSQITDILSEQKLAAGQSGTYKFTLFEAGEYQVICSIQGHTEAGMVATLIAK